MKPSENNTKSHKDIVDNGKKNPYLETTEDFNYLYPNGHRITHQMRWFKVVRDGFLAYDKPA